MKSDWGVILSVQRSVSPSSGSCTSCCASDWIANSRPRRFFSANFPAPGGRRHRRLDNNNNNDSPMNLHPRMKASVCQDWTIGHFNQVVNRISIRILLRVKEYFLPKPPAHNFSLPTSHPLYPSISLFGLQIVLLSISLSLGGRQFYTFNSPSVFHQFPALSFEKFSRALLLFGGSRGISRWDTLSPPHASPRDNNAFNSVYYPNEYYTQFKILIPSGIVRCSSGKERRRWRRIAWTWLRQKCAL